MQAKKTTSTLKCHIFFLLEMFKDTLVANYSSYGRIFLHVKRVISKTGKWYLSFWNLPIIVVNDMKFLAVSGCSD